MKKIILIRTLSVLSLIGCVIFIFHNSLQPADVSALRSEDARDFLDKIFGYLMKRFLIDDHYVRKLAHIIEFAGLGFVARLNIRVWKLENRRPFCIGGCFGLLIAIIDEAIQLFVPGRAGRFSDVLIDFSGFIVGFFICLMLLLWYNKSQCAKKRALKEEEND